MKTAKRICNFRVFFEADDEMLNQPLYEQNYGKNVVGPEHSWMLLASKAASPLSLELDGLRAPSPLALMPPTGTGLLARVMLLGCC